MINAECVESGCAWWDGKQCAVRTIAENGKPVELEHVVELSGRQSKLCDEFCETIAKALKSAGVIKEDNNAK